MQDHFLEGKRSHFSASTTGHSGELQKEVLERTQGQQVGLPARQDKRGTAELPEKGLACTSGLRPPVRTDRETLESMRAVAKASVAGLLVFKLLAVHEMKFRNEPNALRRW